MKKILITLVVALVSAGCATGPSHANVVRECPLGYVASVERSLSGKVTRRGCAKIPGWF